MVPVDVPCVHLSFALIDGICHVFFKLRGICVLSNTSCKHVRHPFPHISGMNLHVQFPQLQARVEYFDLVCQFWSNPRCTILILVLWQLKIHIADLALISTFKPSNTDVRVILSHRFGCLGTIWRIGPAYHHTWVEESCLVGVLVHINISPHGALGSGWTLIYAPGVGGGQINEIREGHRVIPSAEPATKHCSHCRHCRLGPSRRRNDYTQCPQNP